MGDLVRSPYHDLRGDQPILQMGIGPFDGGADLEPLLLGGRQHPLLLAPLVRIDDGDLSVCDDEILDGFRIIGTIHQ